MSADRPDVDEQRPPDAERSTLDRLIPELLKKVIETGTKNLSSETIRQVVSDLKLPREAIHYTFSQLDETKNVVYRAISKEVHDLLERTNIAEELAKALSLLSLEVKMEVRFKPTSADVKTRVTRVKSKDGDEDSSGSEDK
jgi:hypothetical protein